jgi:hypothetical protein
MKTPFRLDDHPRRPQPLAPPPDGYFDKLPMRVMQRVEPQALAATGPLAVPGWLAALSAPLRTALASTVVLGGFAASFLLSGPGAVPTAPTAGTLASVPRTELVEYLLANEQRITLTDLAELPATAQTLPESYLQASSAELQDVLDAQPTDETYL